MLATTFGGGPTELGAALGRPDRVRGFLEASLLRRYAAQSTVLPG